MQTSNDNNFFDFVSQRFYLPYEDLFETFDGLRNHKLLFTLLPENSREVDKFPVRMIGFPPSDITKTSVLSCGPYPVKKDFYDAIMSHEDLDDNARNLLFNFNRVSYENTGRDSPQNFRLSHGEDDREFYEMNAFGLEYDFDNPIIKGDYVWICPGEKVKKIVEKITNLKFEVDDYSWWNIQIDFGDSWGSSSIADFKDEYVIYHEYIAHWIGYMPKFTNNALLSISVELGSLAKKTKYTRNQILHIIKNSFKKAQLEDAKSKENFIQPDKEILIKELFEYNKLLYPVNPEDAFDLFLELKILKRQALKKGGIYKLNINPPNPDEYLKYPNGWKRRMDKYRNTGSVLFSYLSLEEITESLK